MALGAHSPAGTGARPNGNGVSCAGAHERSFSGSCAGGRLARSLNAVRQADAPKACLPIEENEMRRYHQVSGAFFCLLAAVQLTRVILRWPVQIADMAVPLWASVLASLVTLAFAIWAFRTAKGAQSSPGH